MIENDQQQAAKLEAYIERIERIEEERKELAADVAEVYASVKADGYDTKVVRQIIALRKLNPADRAELEFLRDAYKKLLGLED